MTTNGESKNVRLGNLPPSADEFWGGAEKIPVVNEEVYKDCNHYFLLVRAKEAQCKFCNWGIFLGPGDEINDGHLYTGGKKII